MSKSDMRTVRCLS